MKAFVSWSSGKDCMYALYHFLRTHQNSEIYLLNMTEEGSDLSRTHGIHNSLVVRQAEQMGFPLIQQPTTSGHYEADFKQAVRTLIAEHGVTAGVFGDIYLEPHREWIVRVCEELGIKPIFPLWGKDTKELMTGFIKSGFMSIVVALRKDKLAVENLGQIISNGFITYLSTLPGVDVCGENGEYHSFVFDGPLFKSRVKFQIGETKEDEKNYYLELK